MAWVESTTPICWISSSSKKEIMLGKLKRMPTSNAVTSVVIKMTWSLHLTKMCAKVR